MIDAGLLLGERARSDPRFLRAAWYLDRARLLGASGPSMFDAHGQLQVTTVATAPSPAISGTTLTLAADFLNVAGSQLVPPYNATVYPPGSSPTSANAETIRVTADTAGALTIVRAQEGTSAQAVAVGWVVENVASVKTFTDIEGSFVAAPAIFTATGANTWTPSTTGSALFAATLVGGGGGGASYNSTNGGGGGGGGEVIGYVYLGNIVGNRTVTIGAGGIGGAAGGNVGGPGGATSIGALITAAGGYGGDTSYGGNPGNFNVSASSATQIAGRGGAGNIISAAGDAGGGYGFNLLGCGGGGGGGPTSATGGASGDVNGAVGGTGAALGGGGGASGTVAGGNGSAGVGGTGATGAANTGNGGGGAGAGTTTGAGGNGGSGYVIIYQIA